MKPGALLLFSEPKGHVTQEDFNKALAIAQVANFKVETQLEIKRSNSVLLKK